MNTENSKTNDPHRFRLPITDKINLKGRHKNMTMANVSIYSRWEDIKSAYNDNKCKISATAWNDEFDLPDGSYSISDIQDYFEYIIKKHETIPDNPPVQIFSNKNKNRIAFKTKRSYEIESSSPETMKLLGSTTKMLINIKIEKMYQN